MELGIARSFLWEQGSLRLLDQTRLPAEEVYIDIDDLETAAEAIKMLRIRGAPAIGTFAAAALVEVLRRQVAAGKLGSSGRFLDAAVEYADVLTSTRPTGVNLSVAMERLKQFVRAAVQPSDNGSVAGLLAELEAEARSIVHEDEEMCRAIGQHGNSVIPQSARIVTHCNTGALATSGIGTALAAIYSAHMAGKQLEVFADETRPLLQGARLTAWELHRAGIPVRVVTDGMAAYLMQHKKIDLVIVGADRIAANGDAANKIGTCSLAIVARHYDVPFYVAAPSTTFDLTLANGAGIPIEERRADEVLGFGGVQTAPDVEVCNPAFDVTPADLIAGIITETGVHRPPYNFAG